jgi:hypothetical protein
LLTHSTSSLALPAASPWVRSGSEKGTWGRRNFGDEDAVVVDVIWWVLDVLEDVGVERERLSRTRVGVASDEDKGRVNIYSWTALTWGTGSSHTSRARRRSMGMTAMGDDR